MLESPCIADSPDSSFWALKYSDNSSVQYRIGAVSPFSFASACILIDSSRVGNSGGSQMISRCPLGWVTIRPVSAMNHKPPARCRSLLASSSGSMAPSPESVSPPNISDIPNARANRVTTIPEPSSSLRDFLCLISIFYTGSVRGLSVDADKQGRDHQRRCRGQVEDPNETDVGLLYEPDWDGTKGKA